MCNLYIFKVNCSCSYSSQQFFLTLQSFTFISTTVAKPNIPCDEHVIYKFELWSFNLLNSHSNLFCFAFLFYETRSFHGTSGWSWSIFEAWGGLKIVEILLLQSPNAGITEVNYHGWLHVLYLLKESFKELFSFLSSPFFAIIVFLFYFHCLGAGDELPENCWKKQLKFLRVEISSNEIETQSLQFPQ